MFAFVFNSYSIVYFGEISPKHSVYQALNAKEDLRALSWARVPQVPVFILNKRPTRRSTEEGRLKPALQVVGCEGGEHFSYKIFIIFVRHLPRGGVKTTFPPLKSKMGRSFTSVPFYLAGL